MIVHRVHIILSTLVFHACIHVLLYAEDLGTAHTYRMYEDSHIDSIVIIYLLTIKFVGIQIQISHHISWTRTSNEGGDCDRTVISLRRLLGQGLGQLSCRAGCKGVIGTMDYHCTDFSEEEDWSVGRRSYLYEANKVEYFVAS